MRLPACLLAASIVSSLVATALADGTRVRSWITTEQLVDRSAQILVCEVERVDHDWRTVRAYGRDRRYVARYQVQVKIIEVLRGDQTLRNKRIWLQRHGQARPGKWVLVEQGYNSTFSLLAPKRGSRFIAYARTKGVLSIVKTKQGERDQLPVSEVDDVARLNRVRARVTKHPRPAKR